MADELFDRALELVMDAGQTLLENGGEVFRAQQTMEIMAASLGVRDFHVYVLTTASLRRRTCRGGMPSCWCGMCPPCRSIWAASRP